MSHQTRLNFKQNIKKTNKQKHEKRSKTTHQVQKRIILLLIVNIIHIQTNIKHLLDHSQISIRNRFD